MAVAVLSELERVARRAWLAWAVYRGHHRCGGCGEHVYCGRHRPSEPWLCIACFDLADKHPWVSRALR